MRFGRRWLHRFGRSERDLTELLTRPLHHIPKAADVTPIDGFLEFAHVQPRAGTQDYMSVQHSDTSATNS